MKGVFITMEGPDGAGKSTQIKLLGDYLEGQGRQVIYTREPGGTPISEQIREILLNPQNNSMVFSTEALLYAAARAQHVAQVIRPALDQGKVIICDRFTDSTVAYQGYGRGIDLNFIAQVNNLATQGLSPDITLILDLPVEEGLARVKGRTKNQLSDRIEQESLNFHQRVRNGFLQIAAQEPQRCHVINAQGIKAATNAAITKVVEAFLKS